VRRLSSLFGKREKEKPQEEEIPIACPYCGEILPKRPTRKRKCPFCRNVICVRTDPDTREKMITTEKDAQEIDVRRKRIAYRKRWIGRLALYGITDQHFEAKKAQLGKEFQKEPRDADVVWGLFNNLLTQQMKTSDHDALKGLYYDMALFAEEEGREFFHLLQQARKMELLHWREAGIGVTKVEILTAGDKACPSCQPLRGKIFKIKDALKEMPIPNKDCTTHWHHPKQGFCRCSYLPVIPEP